MNELSADLGKIAKLTMAFKKMFTLKAIKKRLRNATSVMLVGYILGMNMQTIKKIFATKIDPTEMSLSVTYIILLYILINRFCYVVPEYILRWSLHRFIKAKIIKITNTHLSAKHYRGKRNQVDIARIFAWIIKRFIIQTGLENSKIFNEPFDTSEIDIEKEFNDQMKEFYSWFILAIHSFIAIILVWKFFTWWFLLVWLLVLVYITISTMAMAFVVLNLEFIEVVRRFIVRENMRDERKLLS